MKSIQCMTMVAAILGLLCSMSGQAAEDQLEAVRKARAEKLAVIEVDAAKKRDVVNKQYLKTLADLQVTLTKAGKLEGATAVKKEIENVDAEFSFFGGHRYKLFPETCTWIQAKRKCAALGGYLVCVDTKDEWEFVLSMIRSVETPLPVWSGGNMTKKGIEFLDGTRVARDVKWVGFYRKDATFEDPKRKLILHLDGYHQGPGWDAYLPETTGQFSYICEWDK